MLTSLPRRQTLPMPSRQRGVVLLITLIMLVAMTLAALAMMRSVDTSTMVAGNLAFQQTSFHTADVGTEQAIAYLYGTIYPNRTCSGTTATTTCPNGYQSSHDPALEPPNATWASYWNSMAGGPGVIALTGLPAGYSGAFVIEAMCSGPGQAEPCIKATDTLSTTKPQGQDMGSTSRSAQDVSATRTSIYYRITTRVEGPRNSVGYVQAMVAL
jgi:type IV pilus assembly protein PilX